MLLRMAYFVSSWADRYQILKSAAMREEWLRDKNVGRLPLQERRADIVSTGSYRDSGASLDDLVFPAGAEPAAAFY